MEQNWLRQKIVEEGKHVRAERLGLSRVAPLAPKASASTNFATPACLLSYLIIRLL